MTARAVETRPSPASIRVPGVASTAIRDVLSGPETTATVLGTASQAVWLLVEEDVVVVSTRDATRLPNGIETATEEAVAGFRMVRHNASATVGSGRVAFDGLIVDVARWWNPRPTLRRISAAELESAVSDLPSTVPDIASGPLSAALSTRVPTGVLHAAEALIGRGPGLTPEGDDLSGRCSRCHATTRRGVGRSGIGSAAGLGRRSARTVCFDTDADVLSRPDPTCHRGTGRRTSRCPAPCAHRSG